MHTLRLKITHSRASAIRFGKSIPNNLWEEQRESMYVHNSFWKSEIELIKPQIKKAQPSHTWCKVRHIHAMPPTLLTKLEIMQSHIRPSQ